MTSRWWLVAAACLPGGLIIAGIVLLVRHRRDSRRPWTTRLIEQYKALPDVPNACAFGPPARLHRFRRRLAALRKSAHGDPSTLIN